MAQRHSLRVVFRPRLSSRRESLPRFDQDSNLMERAPSETRSRRTFPHTPRVPASLRRRHLSWSRERVLGLREAASPAWLRLEFHPSSPLRRRGPRGPARRSCRPETPKMAAPPQRHRSANPSAGRATARPQVLSCFPARRPLGATGIQYLPRLPPQPEEQRAERLEATTPGRPRVLPLRRAGLQSRQRPNPPPQQQLPPPTSTHEKSLRCPSNRHRRLCGVSLARRGGQVNHRSCDYTVSTPVFETNPRLSAADVSLFV